jgi:hypothetical protein
MNKIMKIPSGNTHPSARIGHTGQDELLHTKTVGRRSAARRLIGIFALRLMQKSTSAPGC